MQNNRLNAVERDVDCSNHGGLDFGFINQQVRLSNVVPSESASRLELERGLKAKYPEDDVQTALTDYESQNGELPPSYEIFDVFLKNSKVDLKEENKQLKEEKSKFKEEKTGFMRKVTKLEHELKATKERLKEEMIKTQSYKLGQNQTDIPFALQEPRQNFAHTHKYLFVVFMILIVVFLLIFMYFFYHGCLIPCFLLLK